MLIRRYSNPDDEQWAPVSDMMAGIMLVFMLIAMILLIHFNLGRNAEADSPIDYAGKEKKRNEKLCDGTKERLRLAFDRDFEGWGAALEPDLTIRFTSKRVLFETASSDVERADIEGGGWFAEMIRDFFPRYMEAVEEIREERGEDEVLSIRIEGHTSSEYENPGKDGAYIKNMELSQDRARKILQFVRDHQKVPDARHYDREVLRLITANGLSSSRLICDKDGKEDKRASRRVEFKLLTKSCQKAGVYDPHQEVVNPCLEEVLQ